MCYFSHTFCKKMCQKCSLVQLRAGLCVGQSGSSPLNLLIRDFMDLVLCTGARSCWNRKCPGMLMYYVPSTGTKEMCPTPENPPPNFTLGTVVLDKYRSPGKNQSEPHPSDCQVEEHLLPLQRTSLHCSRVL